MHLRFLNFIFGSYYIGVMSQMLQKSPIGKLKREMVKTLMYLAYLLRLHQPLQYSFTVNWYMFAKGSLKPILDIIAAQGLCRIHFMQLQDKQFFSRVPNNWILLLGFHV